VRQARLAPVMISTPGLRVLRRRQRRTPPAWSRLPSHRGHSRHDFATVQAAVRALWRRCFAFRLALRLWRGSSCWTWSCWTWRLSSPGPPIRNGVGASSLLAVTAAVVISRAAERRAWPKSQFAGYASGPPGLDLAHRDQPAYPTREIGSLHGLTERATAEEIRSMRPMPEMDAGASPGPDMPRRQPSRLGSTSSCRMS